MRTKHLIVAAALMGGALGVLAAALDKIENRVAFLERRRDDRPAATKAPLTIREMQRQSARDFVEVLREENLVVTEQPVDGSDAA